MEENNNIDQHKVAESINKNIKLIFGDFFLCKPLETIKVKKEFDKPITNDVPKKDKNGIAAKDYDDVEKEIKEVDATYQKAIILSIPVSYVQDDKYPSLNLNIGDTIVYKRGQVGNFDLLKDTILIRRFDIIAKVND